MVYDELESTGGIAMAGRRVLSLSEKCRIVQDRMAKERALHPASTIEIRVADETDDRGQPIITIEARLNSAA